MTVQFNEERYQSDRLTFERQQFEEAFKEAFGRPWRDSTMFLTDETGVYLHLYTGAAWTGWKLSRGLI